MTYLRKHADFTYLCVMSLLGSGLLFYATATYGAGLPTDSAWYLSAAENLLRGGGLVTFDTSPLSAFPPLYTFLLAALSHLLALDVFLAGWYLNGVLHGVNIFLSGLLLKDVFSSRRVFFYFGVLILVFSPSFMRMHASLLTEPLFLTLMLLSIFAARSYVQRQDLKLIVWLGLLAALAPLLRFVGMSFILSGLAVILLVHWKNWRLLLQRGFLFGLVAAPPFVAWSYFFNYLQYGAFLYPSIPRAPDFWVNLSQAVRKVFYWFVPYRPLTSNGVLEALIFLLIVVLVMFVINRKKDWLAWLNRFREPLPLISLLYAGVYFIALTATANTPDHYALISDRYYAAIFFAILLVLFIGVETLVLPHMSYSNRAIQIGLLCLFFLWMNIPVMRTFEYVQKSHTNGEDGYNLYNTRAFHESELIIHAQKILQEDPEASFYSNIPAAVWFFTRHTMMPVPDKYGRWTKDEYKTKMAGWPYDKPGYVIWFDSDPFKIFYHPGDLYLIADIYPVYEVSDGTVYYVSARK